jgi:hypothetical protein
MKGDFSRTTFDPRKHYSGVLMQQGRVQLDADWNEQEAIQRRRTQVEARDVIGRCGAPEDDAGFEIAIAANKLTIGAGRFYVDGLLAETETDDLAYEAQPDLPDPPSWTDALTTAGTNFGLVYLDVWERHITPLDDRLLREVALGGPDTATRIRTVWQLRVLPLAAVGDLAELESLRAERAAVQAKLDETIAAGGDTDELVALLAEIDKKIADLEAHPDCDDQLDEWDDLVANPERRLNARSQPPTNVDGPCVVPPSAGYRRLENQLYRVEVHKGGPRSTATFKWSRDNGTVVTALERISGKDVVVHDLGPDDVLGFADGQWVELTDDATELAGLPGQLFQIDTITESQRTITLKAAPTPLASVTGGVDPQRHPKLRRWDQKTTAGTNANGVAMASGWMPLEDGVEVQFSNATFRTGDYWVIPARTATGDLEWPPFEVPNAAPEAQMPRGIEHHYCRLALIAFDPTTKEWGVVEDCRPIFPPLTECCDERARANRVVETNWRNDDPFPAATLARNGLRIRLERPPDPLSLSNDTVLVAVDLPAGTGESASPNQVHRVYIRGSVARDPTDDNVVVWRVTAPDSDAGPRAGRRGARRSRVRAERDAEAVFREAVGRVTVVNLQFRVHVTVKGGCVWTDDWEDTGELAYLDGHALGRPGARVDGSPRIDLSFPSGIGVPASDFESWFVIGQRQAPEAGSFRVAEVSFRNPDDMSSSAGSVEMPPPADRAVGFKAAEEITSVLLTFSEPVLAETIGAGEAALIHVERGSGRRAERLVADVRLEEGQDSIVRLRLRDPAAFQPGNHVLTVVGTNADGDPGGILSAAETAVDGDYDGSPGGDLRLPFRVT